MAIPCRDRESHLGASGIEGDCHSDLNTVRVLARNKWTVVAKNPRIIVTAFHGDEKRGSCGLHSTYS